MNDCNDVRYIYIRGSNGLRKGVVAYTVENGKLVLGASFCADGDTFDPDYGKQVAANRRSVNGWSLKLRPDIRSKDVARLALAEAVGGRQGDWVDGMPLWLGSSQTARGLVRRMLRRQ